MRKWSLMAVVLALAVAGGVAWKVSQPVVLRAGASMGNIVYDGQGDTYRELAGFDVTSWKCRQWFREKEIVTLGGCIATDQPRTKVRLRDIKPSGDTSVTWRADVGMAGEDGKEMSPGITVSITYDFSQMTVTLDNTGERLAFSSDRVFTVQLDGDFKPGKMVAFRCDAPPPDLHHRVREFFSKIAAAKANASVR